MRVHCTAEDRAPCSGPMKCLRIMVSHVEPRALNALPAKTSAVLVTQTVVTCGARMLAATLIVGRALE